MFWILVEFSLYLFVLIDNCSFLRIYVRLVLLAIQRNYATLRKVDLCFRLEPENLLKKRGGGYKPELKKRWKKKMDKIYDTFMEGPSILEKAYKISRKTLEKVRKLPDEMITLIQAFTWDYYFVENFQNEKKVVGWPTKVEKHHSIFEFKKKAKKNKNFSVSKRRRKPRISRDLRRKKKASIYRMETLPSQFR